LASILLPCVGMRCHSPASCSCRSAHALYLRGRSAAVQHAGTSVPACWPLCSIFWSVAVHPGRITLGVCGHPASSLGLSFIPHPALLHTLNKKPRTAYRDLYCGRPGRRVRHDFTKACRLAPVMLCCFHVGRFVLCRGAIHAARSHPVTQPWLLGSHLWVAPMGWWAVTVGKGAA
jgi:hypothetical protein